MANSAEFKVTLIIDSQGNAKIEEVKKGLESTGGAAKKAGQDGAAAADNFHASLEKIGNQTSSLTGQLGSLVGVTLSVAGAAYIVEKAWSTWKSMVSNGIGIVDDYQKKIIGTSYILTTMSNVPPPELSEAYGQWKDYFAWLYQQSLDADKKSAASAQEIFGVSVELAKKGVIAASEEEMDTIGRLTDLMKAVTPTYASLEQQARGEIEAMMSGTTRMGAQTAIILAQIDPAFKKNIASAREQGTVLEYVRSILPQIKQYTTDLMGTWDAVGASLKSAWQVINLQAFGDAHRDVVSLAQQLGDKLVQNGHLTEQGEAAAAALGVTWSAAKDKAASLLDYVINNGPEVISTAKGIASAVGTIGGAAISSVKGVATLVQELQRASENPLIGALLGAAGGSRLGPWGAIAGGAAGFVAAGQHGNEAEVARGLARAQKEFEGYEIPGEGLGLPYTGKKSISAPPTPPTRPFTSTGKGSGGGGSGRDTTDTLENLILQLRQEEAKLTEGAFSGVDAWYTKVGEKIRKLAMDDQQLKDGMLAASELKAAKEQKISDDLNKKYLQATHQTAAVQEADDKKLIDQMAGHPKELQQAWDIYYSHKKDQADKLAMAENQQVKGYIDSLAASATSIEKQVALKKLSLDYEVKISQQQLEQWLKGQQISGALADDYRSLLGMVNASKQYNAERQRAVELGTLEGWAIERSKTGQSQFNAKNLLTGVESFSDNALTQGIQGALSKTKTDWMEVGKTMAQSMVLNLGKAALSEGITAIAHRLSPPDSQGGAEGVGGVLGRIMGAKAPTGASNNPFYVIPVGAGGAKGVSGLIGGGGIGSAGGSSEVNEVAGMWRNVTNGFKGVFSQGSSELDNSSSMLSDRFQTSIAGLLGSSTNFEGMFDTSIEGLLGSADGFGSVFGGFLSGISSLFGGGGGGGGGGISGLLAGAASFIPGVGGFISAGIGAIGSIFGFHGGGEIAHSGLLVAHDGLNTDERLIKAQVGEWIINKDATASLERQGLTFDMANGGRLPLFSGDRLAEPPASEGGKSIYHDYQQAINSIGVVAHSGLLVAHDGLDLDERIVKAQTGEGLIKQGTMADYARAGISFDDLNSGRLPAIDRGRRGVGPDGLNGSTVNNYDNKQATIHVTIGDIHAYDMTPQEAEKFVARKIMPAINKQMGDRARTIYG